MALDTNPNANMVTPQPQAQTPSYLQQQNNPSAAGAVNNMVRALMAGNDQYKQAHPTPQGPVPLAAGSAIPGAMGPTSVGGMNGPMPLMGATNPATMTGGMGSAPIPTPAPRPDAAPVQPPFPAGPTNPVAMDPVSQALMSQIPGMTNG